MTFTPLTARINSWPDSGSSVIWLTESTGRQLYLKQFSSAAKFSNEVRAYRDWLPLLSFPAPALVAHDPSLRALLITDAGQSIGNFSELPTKSQHELMQQAGELFTAVTQKRVCGRRSDGNWRGVNNPRRVLPGNAS